MRARIACLVIALAGCSFRLAGAPDDGSIGTDAVSIDASGACAQWQPHLFDPCDIPAPLGGLHLTPAGSPYTFNTTTGSGTLHDQGGTLIPVAGTTLDQADPAGTVTTAVISVASLELDAGVQLRVIGAKPLIVASWSSITVAGAIDAGSYVAGNRRGAGQDPPQCADNVATVGEAGGPAGGSGGGGGGGFRGTGGGGGSGDANFASGDHIKFGGSGGGAVLVPSILRGGCAGADSGIAGSYVPSNPDQVGAKGAGGGAIHLAARATITIAGDVLAGGAGGGGAPTSTACGGGGGGAGGFIGLDAPAVQVMGVIAANGGGGGQSGSSSTAGVAGVDGQRSASRAAGATGAACGPPGGAGGAGATADGLASMSVDSCGGGGGGGAAGFVVVWSPDYGSNGATVSPDETRNP